MNILERQLIVKDKLLTIVCRKRDKSNLRLFHKTPTKIELRLCECNNPSSLVHLIRHYGITALRYYGTQPPVTNIQRKYFTTKMWICQANG